VAVLCSVFCLWLAWKDEGLVKDHPEHVSRRAFDRERRARHDAEEMLENKARELWETNKALAAMNEALEERVAERTAGLEKAIELAEEASNAKSRFLANMSHELRTPMTAILGYTDVLLDGDESAEERLGRLKTIHRNGEYLLALINDILDMSKVEAGKMTVERIETRLLGLVESVREMFADQAAEKGIGLEVCYCTDLPGVIGSDPVRLRQVLINLVGNAIKFTNRGSVRILVSYDDGMVQFGVEDSGIGMSTLQLEGVFESFKQADNSMVRKYGGTGLGLYISKRLAGLLGGDLTAESVEGRGSLFTLRVEGLAVGGGLVDPSGMIDVSEIKSSVNVPGEASLTPGRIGFNGELDGISILLVEDGIDNQRLIRHVLTKAGAKVEIRENGRLAVDHLVDEGGAGLYQLVLMDMQMPVLDGYGACRELRALGVEIPIIALTAHAMSHDRGLCLEAGCDDFATKPIDRAKLVSMCRRWGRPGLSSAA